VDCDVPLLVWLLARGADRSCRQTASLGIISADHSGATAAQFCLSRRPTCPSHTALSLPELVPAPEVVAQEVRPRP
jgi:hypothetical protein